ncbi:hypothetical protein KKB10_00125 [Patescibacteria group bacterium]|nr:hypothetical protein [Patescibacteria group bacterium]MBU1951554.1 hypothetical protein [Patescibacteria group bacterium]
MPDQENNKLLSHKEFVDGYINESFRVGVHKEAAIELMNSIQSPGLSKVFYYGSRISLIWLLSIVAIIITYIWVHWIVALIIVLFALKEQVRLSRLPGLQIINYALKDEIFYRKAIEKGIIFMR